MRSITWDEIRHGKRRSLCHVALHVSFEDRGKSWRPEASSVERASKEGDRDERLGKGPLSSTSLGDRDRIALNAPVERLLGRHGSAAVVLVADLRRVLSTER